jgi:putative phosphoribosyl transferase
VSRAFRDRAHAGDQLADLLLPLAGPDLLVLGLPRGGVPVAARVATRLEAPLDVVLVRKLGVPAQPELAMGAIGEGGVEVLESEVLRLAHVTDEQLAEVRAREQVELRRRAERYRQGRPAPAVQGHRALLVDDGIATGASARAALQVVRAAGATSVVLAVPVAPGDAAERLGGAADGLVAVEQRDDLRAVGQAYDDFTATTDQEVVDLLGSSR